MILFIGFCAVAIEDELNSKIVYYRKSARRNNDVYAERCYGRKTVGD